MPERRWTLALRDMLDACERCVDYTAGMDQAAFVGDRRTYDATIRNIEIVGSGEQRAPDSVGGPPGDSVAWHRRYKEPDHSRLWSDR